MIINKFGGEIMGDPSLVKLAVKQVKNQLKAGQKPVVVVSALKGVTDELVELCHKYDDNIIDRLEKAHQTWEDEFKIQNSKFPPEADPPLAEKIAIKNLKLKLNRDGRIVKKVKNKVIVRDRILACGEQWSSLLFTALLNKNSVQAVRFTGEELGVLTDDKFGDANVNYARSARNIRTQIKKIEQINTDKNQCKSIRSIKSVFHRVPVITGFIGKTAKGQTTTLGRGGSDTTACLVGAALKASKIILWKNVAGVLTADPKIVKNPKTVNFLNYQEAEESGKVIHDKAMRLVRKTDVQVEVAYIQNPRQKTVITEQGSKVKGVKIISSKDSLRLFIITGEKIKHYGALSEIARVFSKHKVNMALIRNTRDSLYIAVEKNSHNFSLVEHQITVCGYELKCQDVSMINVIGRLDWHIVEKVNYLLYANYPEAVLGAFPYKNCVRLEAVVSPEQTIRLIRTFHKELVK